MDGGNCVECPVRSNTPPANMADDCMCNDGYVTSSGSMTTSGDNCNCKLFINCELLYVSVRARVSLGD